MKRIDDLLTELCPDGAPYRLVADVMNVVPIARGVKRSDYTKGSLIPIVDQGQSRIAGFTDDLSAAVPTGDYIVFGEHTRAIKWVDFAFAPGADGTKVLRAAEGLIPKFAYYALANLAIPSRGYNRHWTVLRELRIPVPPLEVQREIVRILDQFTQLEAELEAELEARSRQYNYLQQHVFLALDDAGVQKLPLGEVGKWYGGGTPSKKRPEYWKSGTIPWISPKDMGRTLVDSTEDYITEDAVAESATKLIPKDSVALVARSSILNHTLPIAYVPISASLNQDMKAVIAGPDILPRYLFHVLRAYRTNLLRTARRNGGSVASLESRRLWEFEIPVPDVTEQERLVKLLDNFDTLLNDPAVGLPAELESRRKQYEYYRDRLLTFKEAAA